MVIQVLDGDLDEGISGGRGKNWLDSGCIWEVKLTEFTDRLDVGCGSMRGVQDAASVLSVSNAEGENCRTVQW